MYLIQRRTMCRALLYIPLVSSWVVGIQAFGQGIDDRLRIYSDVAEQANVDQRVRTDKVMRKDGELVVEVGDEFIEPFFIYPAAVASRQSLNHQAGDAEGAGTHCEFNFNLGATEFCGIKFVPGGVDPGGKTHPGIDVKRRLRLTEASNVFLTFRARTAPGTRAVATFKTGGTAGRTFKDSLVFPVSPTETPTRLGEEWRTIDIPLRGKDLSSVICPLEILVKRDENPGNGPIVVHVDDVQYEVRAAAPRRQE